MAKNYAHRNRLVTVAGTRSLHSAASGGITFRVTAGEISPYSSARYNLVKWTKTKVTWTDGPPVNDVAATLEEHFENPPGGYRLTRRITDAFAAAHAFRACNRNEPPRSSLSDAAELTTRERSAGTIVVALCGEQSGGQRERLYARFLRDNGTTVVESLLGDAERLRG